MAKAAFFLPLILAVTPIAHADASAKGGSAPDYAAEVEATAGASGVLTPLSVPKPKTSADCEFHIDSLPPPAELTASQIDSWSFKLVLEFAERGFPGTYDYVGLSYATGKGVTQNYTEAQKWLKRSADLGCQNAQYHLGLLYNQLSDYGQALQMFRKAADQHNASAQNGLGLMYYSGLGVSRDYVEAFKWFRLASEQGEPAGEDNLGDMYSKGLGVARDDKLAEHWYRRSAEQGEKPALVSLAGMYEHHQNLAHDLVLACMLYQIAANAGDENAAKLGPSLMRKLSPAQQAETKALASAWTKGSPLPDMSKTGQMKQDSSPAQAARSAYRNAEHRNDVLP